MESIGGCRQWHMLERIRNYRNWVLSSDKLSLAVYWIEIRLQTRYIIQSRLIAYTLDESMKWYVQSAEMGMDK